MPRLILKQSDGARRVVALGPDPLRLGRGGDRYCDIDISDELAGQVSRTHARIWTTSAGDVLVEDLGSKNGTRVDDGPPFWREVRAASRSVTLGDRCLEIQLDPPPAPTLNETNATVLPLSQALNLAAGRLQRLMDLTERISLGAFDRQQLLQQALDACVDTFAFDRAMIALRAPRGDVQEPVLHNMTPEQVSRTILRPALEEGSRVCVNDIAADIDGPVGESVMIHNICSALCVPVTHHADVLGVVYGVRTSSHAPRFTTEDVDFLAAVAQQVGVGLVQLQLLADRLKLLEQQFEMRQAREIQRMLFPQAPFDKGSLRIVGRNEPAGDVGGDYYDFAEVDERQTAFLIADVAGHGAASALVMSSLQAAVHMSARAKPGDANIAERLNRFLCANTPTNIFVTGVIGIVDVQQRLLRLFNAGHHPPVLVSSNAARVATEAAECAIALGIAAEEPYEPIDVPLGAEPCVALFYTDGLTEAANADGVQLGLDAVCAALTHIASPTADAVLDVAQNVLKAHLQSQPSADDVTLLAVELR